MDQCAHERLIDHCKGLWTDGQSLWVSSKSDLWRFENTMLSGRRRPDGVDRLFVSREGRVTGQIDIHDIGMCDLSRFTNISGYGPAFVCTAFNCLATVSDKYSFQPLWKPPFISEVSGGDRCHLNGLAMSGDRAAYVSVISRTDVLDGWREDRRSGGIIMDIETKEVVVSGLSMPHSPRLYDGKLWVLNSGHGELCIVDPDSGKTVPIAFCPGYSRGLAFIGNYAVIGLSRPRHNDAFGGLVLDEKLAAAGEAPMCGLIVVDIETGKIVEWMRFEHTIEELYDISILEGIRQPEAIGFLGDAIGVSVQLPVDAF